LRLLESTLTRVKKNFVFGIEMDALQIDTGNGEYGKTWSGKYSSCRIYHKKRRQRGARSLNSPSKTIIQAVSLPHKHDDQ
jgi:hypothetical protein